MKKNMAASVRQKLLNVFRKTGRTHQELYQYYAMERFLYRLSISKYRDSFVLKGALMLQVWGAPFVRPTMDIDMLGKISNQEESIKDQIRDLLSISIEDDGLQFDLDSIRAEEITKEADYNGLRIHIKCILDTIKISIQIDIGFDDMVYPEPVQSDFPSLLGNDSPKIWCYSRESAIAEKTEAMVSLGSLNSRMKDFYDIWSLACEFTFRGADLSEALRRTFEKRKTAIPEKISSIQTDFADSQNQIQWKAFRRRLNHSDIPEDFQVILRELDQFLSPVIKALNNKSDFLLSWSSGGPWE